MGSRGPAKTPTKLRVLAGETRPSQINHQEPKPRQAPPVMPEGMGDAAQKVWTRVLADYDGAGVITAIDADAFRIFCEAVARYEHAVRLLDESGPLIRGARRGELVKNPLHQIVRDNADLARSLAREFGLTPSSRTGIRTNEPASEDPFESWMRRSG